jgi:hypothetical protein
VDGAGGFLPGVPLGCLGMASQRRPQRHVPAPKRPVVERIALD